MTAQLTKAIWTRSQQRGAALLRLLALASYANRQGLAWPKLITLARRTALEPFRLQQRLEERLELRAPQVPAQLPQRSRWQAQLLRLRAELAQVETQLARIQRPLLRQLPSQLSSSQPAQLETPVAAELQPLQHRLGAQQRERQRRRHEQLRERFGVPRLSLFTFEPPEGSDR